MFSENTTELLMEISSFGNKRINNLNDVGLLIEIGSGEKNLEPVAFTAKYVTGLKTVMDQSTPISDDARENIRKEFSENVSKLKDMLQEFLNNEDESVVYMFSQKYFQLNQESFAELLSLAEDLSLYKEYLNSLKS